MLLDEDGLEEKDSEDDADGEVEVEETEEGDGVVDIAVETLALADGVPLVLPMTIPLGVADTLALFPGDGDASSMSMPLAEGVGVKAMDEDTLGDGLEDADEEADPRPADEDDAVAEAENDADGEDEEVGNGVTVADGEVEVEETEEGDGVVDIAVETLALADGVPLVLPMTIPLGVADTLALFPGDGDASSMSMPLAEGVGVKAMDEDILGDGLEDADEEADPRPADEDDAVAEAENDADGEDEEVGNGVTVADGEVEVEETEEGDGVVDIAVETLALADGVPLVLPMTIPLGVADTLALFSGDGDASSMSMPLAEGVGVKAMDEDILGDGIEDADEEADPRPADEDDADGEDEEVGNGVTVADGEVEVEETEEGDGVVDIAVETLALADGVPLVLPMTIPLGVADTLALFPGDGDASSMSMPLAEGDGVKAMDEDILGDGLEDADEEADPRPADEDDAVAEAENDADGEDEEVGNGVTVADGEVEVEETEEGDGVVDIAMETLALADGVPLVLPMTIPLGVADTLALFPGDGDASSMSMPLAEGVGVKAMDEDTLGDGLEDADEEADPRPADEDDAVVEAENDADGEDEEVGNGVTVADGEVEVEETEEGDGVVDIAVETLALADGVPLVLPMTIPLGVADTLALFSGDGDASSMSMPLAEGVGVKAMDEDILGDGLEDADEEADPRPADEDDAVAEAENDADGEDEEVGNGVTVADGEVEVEETEEGDGVVDIAMETLALADGVPLVLPMTIPLGVADTLALFPGDGDASSMSMPLAEGVGVKAMDEDILGDGLEDENGTDDGDEVVVIDGEEAVLPEGVMLATATIPVVLTAEVGDSSPHKLALDEGEDITEGEGDQLNVEFSQLQGSLL